MYKKRVMTVISVLLILSMLGLTINSKQSGFFGLGFKVSDAEAAELPQGTGTATSGTIFVPQAVTGVSIKSAEDYVGFIAAVDKNELPSGMESYSKMAVTVSSSSFDVVNKGIPEYIPGTAYKVPNNVYASIVPKAGTWYVLIVLCDSSCKAIGYYETAVEITGSQEVFVPEINQGIKVKTVYKIHGIKVTVNNSKLPSGMESFTKMAVSVSSKPYLVKENGLPNNIASQAKVYPDNSYSSSVQKAGRWYVLTVLYDDNNIALGYSEVSVYIAKVPEIKPQLIETGITVGIAAAYTGYEVRIDRTSLPVWAQDYSKIGLCVSYIKSFDVPAEGLPFDSDSILTIYETPEGITTVGSTAASVKWYILVALYDEYNNPIGYYTGSVYVK